VETEGGCASGNGIDDEGVVGVKGSYDKKHVKGVGLTVGHGCGF
jgi:hypothetical protein